MQIVSFPDFGCGGIICALLNNEPIEFYRLGHVDSPAHYLLKHQSHTEDFDRTGFIALLAKYKNVAVWQGTHIHPLDYLGINGIEKVIYVTASKIESKCLLAIRQLEGGGSDINEGNIETVLAERWFWPNKWQKKVLDERVTNVELWDFYKYPYARTGLFKYCEPKFKQWYVRNDYSKYMETAIKVYHAMNNRPHEYIQYK